MSLVHYYRDMDAAGDIFRRLPKRYIRVLQALVCGTGVVVELIYNSKSNDRYTLKLSGPWHAIVKRAVEDSANVSSANLLHTEYLETLARSPDVLLKMQDAEMVDAEEDICHALITKKTPEIAPKLMTSLTVGCIRLTFMEYLPNAVSLYKLYKDADPVVTKCLIKRIETVVERMWLDAGVIHCDMHPNNVLICGTRVYIIDFGMATPINDERLESMQKLIRKDKKPLRHAFDAICKRFAFRAMTRRGYDVDDDEGWNDDATFLELIHTYLKKVQSKRLLADNNKV
jgi:hypothetical protein